VRQFSGFGEPIGFRGPSGFGARAEPTPVTGFVVGSGFPFGSRVWVRGRSTRPEPDPLPSLIALVHTFTILCVGVVCVPIDFISILRHHLSRCPLANLLMIIEFALSPGGMFWSFNHEVRRCLCCFMTQSSEQPFLSSIMIAKCSSMYCCISLCSTRHSNALDWPL